MKIGVTGITGYLGSAVGKALLSQGKYFVRGSVRSLKNTTKVDPIKHAYMGQEDNYELVEMDLTNEESIYEFAKGLDHIIHVASPFPNISKKQKAEEVITPAVDGTLSILRAASANDIKRVVCTSSVATVSDPHGWKLMYDHEDRVDPDSVDSIYTKSKILAEQAGWDYIKNQGEINGVELVTIHPAGIIGPTLTKGSEFTSMILLRDLATGKYPMLPNISLGFSDVRDTAEAHLSALTCPAGNRYVTVGESLYFAEVAQIIKEECGHHGFSPKTTVMPRLVGKAASFFNPYIKSVLARWGKKIKYDSSLAEKDLNFHARPARESIKDMVDSLVEQGYIKKK